MPLIKLLLTIIFVSLFIVPFNAFGISFLWDWFVFPTFNVATPGIWTLSGLLLTIEAIRYKFDAANSLAQDKIKNFTWVAVSSKVMTIWLFVLFGWFYTKLA